MKRKRTALKELDPRSGREIFGGNRLKAHDAVESLQSVYLNVFESEIANIAFLEAAIAAGSAQNHQVPLITIEGAEEWLIDFVGADGPSSLMWESMPHGQTCSLSASLYVQKAATQPISSH